MTTPQEQSALEKLGEAALNAADLFKQFGDPSNSLDFKILCDRAEAYRAIQAPPRKCRPPENAEDGSRWILTKGDDWTVREWRLWSGRKEPWWCLVDGQPDLQIGKPESGWTVHSECVFPGTGMVATDEWADLFFREHPQTPSETLKRYRGRLVRDITRHFAPKLREISDNQISKIADDDRWPSIAEANFGETVKYVRAIISYVAEGEK